MQKMVSILYFLCKKKMRVVFCLVLLFLACKASEFRFCIQRSTEWQFIGRKVQFKFTLDIPESTPLKIKIKLPFNGTAILRLTEAKVSYISEHLSPSDNTTTLTSSANDGLNDIALFALGNVTRASFENNTKIEIEFEIQVMNHAHVVNGEAQWVSVGAQYKNQSVWASQLAIKTINPASSRPDLKVEIWPDHGDYHLIFGDEVIFGLRLSHSDLTTEEVVSGIIEWPLPPVLLLKSCNKVSSSVDVLVANTTDMVTIKFGRLKFSDKVHLKCRFNLDLHKTKADGKIHDCNTHVTVRYNGSDNACSSSSGFREFTHDGTAVTSFKYYVKQRPCDEALGMQGGSIKNNQITASSYAPGREPYEGRMGGNAWKPVGALSTDKYQFIEVNFKGRVQIRRMGVKGLSEAFVRSFYLYHSNDGVIWTPYKEGSKTKEFVAVQNGKYGAIIILPVPFEAVFVRINPTSWENTIALTVEFFGCNLNQPYIPGPLTFSSRGYLLDQNRGTMYVCRVPMESKKQHSKCFFSSDQGSSWTAMHHGVISLLGHDTAENTLYGVSLNGRAVLKSTTDHSAKFTAVPKSVWDAVKSKSSTNLAVTIAGSDLVATNSTVTPTRVNGTEWAISSVGILVEQSSTWKLKAIWMYTEINECSSNPCSNGTCVDQINGHVCIYEYQYLLCERTAGPNINCGNRGKINVIFANYGRLDGKTCPSGLLTPTDCRAANSLAVVQRTCQSKVNCQVEASNGFFGGDPCKGTHKYVLVKYRCDG